MRIEKNTRKLFNLWFISEPLGRGDLSPHLELVKLSITLLIPIRLSFSRLADHRLDLLGMCAGLARKVNRMPFDGDARGVAPLLFFWGNVPSSGLASFGEGASPFFTVKKTPGQSVS